MCRAVGLLCCLLLPLSAAARTAEPGTLSAGVTLGPSFKAAPLLGGAPAYFTLGLEGEYAVSSALSALVDLEAGLASTVPLRLHAGARYRFVGLPVAPFLQLQFTAGDMLNVMGTHLAFWGARVGLGADTFLTRNISVGAALAADLTSTSGERPAFYSSIDVLLFANWSF